MDRVEDMLARPARYSNIDGMGEISVGLMCVAAWCLWFVAPKTLPLWMAAARRGAVWFVLLGPALSLAWVAPLLLLVRYGIPAFKGHVTYRRTGFVQYRKESRWASTRSFLLFEAVLLPLLFLAVAAAEHWGAAVAVVLSQCMVFGYCQNIAGTRWKWAVAAAMALISVPIALLPTPYIASLARDRFMDGLFRLSFPYARIVGAQGALMIVSGGITLWSYLRHTRPAAREEQ